MATGIPEHKVVLCGEYGVGKTSIFRRFVDNCFLDVENQPTLGLDNFGKTFTEDDMRIKMTLWDTAGIERFVTMSQSYYRGAAAAILCYSLDNRDSFNILSQHILDIVVHTETARIFLCGNKLDLAAGDEVTSSDIENFQLQCDTVLSGVYEISCKTGQGVQEMFADVARTLMETMSPYESGALQLPRKPGDEETKKGGCCS